eukprot:COSAG02_NODE_4303_length_5530_cov_2.345609_3_plen_779_part_01
MPTGLDFYWMSTIVVSVIASPTMFAPSLTSFRSVSVSPIATVPFTAHADLRDWYGNAIETGGIRGLTTNLSSAHCSALFAVVFQDGMGYIVRALAPRNGSFTFSSVSYSNETTQLLGNSQEFHVSAVPCTSEATYADATGSYCLRSTCNRGQLLLANRSGCVSCGIGQYGVGGSSCEPCSGGTICDHDGCGYCEPCGAGKISTGARDACIDCDVGKAPSSSLTNCVSCGPLTYSPRGRECLNCTLPKVVSSDGSSCEACPAGNGPSSNGSMCVPCVGTTYSLDGVCVECNNPNVIDERHARCLRCAAGLGRSDDGTSCVPCNSGYFSRDGVCESCQPPRIVSADKASCSLCEDGKHAFGGMCVDCVGATFATAGTTAGVCKPCEAPRVVDAWHTNCTLCPSGKQANLEQTQCVPCEGDTYSSIDVQLSPDLGGYTGGRCSVCHPPRSVNSEKTQCYKCSPGTGPSSDTCEPCTGNTYSPGGQCETCQMPNVVSADRITCNACPAGTEPNAQQTACIAAASGTYIGADGRSHICEYPNVVNAQKTSCQRCLAGQGPSELCVVDYFSCTNSSNSAGAEDEISDVLVTSDPESDCNWNLRTAQMTTVISLLACDESHPSYNATRTCVACPTGRAGAGGQCEQCVAGKQPNAARTGCERCEPGKAGRGGVCLQCADGTTADAGYITCTPCQSGRAGTGGFCDNCPPGTQPTLQQTACETCRSQGTSLFSANGRGCTPCSPGHQVNDNGTACESCLSQTDSFWYSADGSPCVRCEAGHQPNIQR